MAEEDEMTSTLPAVILLAFFLPSIDSQEIALCREITMFKIPIQQTSFDFAVGRQPSILIRETRSVIECASMCHNNVTCRLAAFKDGGDCLLIGSRIEEIDSYTSGTGNTRVMDFGGVISELSNACPRPCTGTSVCVLDCSLSPGQQIPGCMELGTFQYTSNRCGFQPPASSREFLLINLNKDTTASNYIMFSITFDKKYPSTALMVRFRGTLRGGYGWGAGWGKWRIFFNGAECSNPAPIDASNYNGDNDCSHWKTSGIHGVCYNIPNGTVQIDLRTETSNSYMGIGMFNNHSRMYVDELFLHSYTTEPTIAGCPGLTVFNTRQFSVNQNREDNPYVVLWTFSYTKMDPMTTLKISMDVALRVYIHSGAYASAIFYIRVDGNDCTPHAIGKMIMNDAYAEQNYDEHRTYEIEGYCRGITTGAHTISFVITTNHFYSIYAYDTCVGWNSWTRMIVEEIRENTNVIAAVAPNGRQVLRIPQFNMMIIGAGNPSYGGNNGIIWTLPAYSKLYSTSGIKISISADARNYQAGNAALSHCCRHFFMLNGKECNTPGPLDFITYHNKILNMHRPAYMEGVCDAIPSGTVNIQLAAGKCRNEALVGGCHFGAQSWVHVLVAETFIDRTIINVV